MVVVNEARKRGFLTTAQRFDHPPIVGHRDCAHGSSGNPACGGGGGRQGEGRTRLLSSAPLSLLAYRGRRPSNHALAPRCQTRPQCIDTARRYRNGNRNEQGLSKNTVRLIRGVLSVLLGDAVDNGIVVPLTTGGHRYPFRVSCRFQGKAGYIVLDQIRTVDGERLIRPLGRLGPATVDAALGVLQEMFAP